MRVEDKVLDIFELDGQFVRTENELVLDTEVNYDDLVRVVFNTPYLRNRVFKYSTNELRCLFSWCDKSWQEYIIHLANNGNICTVSILQATHYKVEGGVIINE